MNNGFLRIKKLTSPVIKAVVNVGKFINAKSLSDSADAITDLAKRTLTKVLGDSVSASDDSINFDPNLGPADSSSFSEQVSLGPNKGLSDDAEVSSDTATLEVGIYKEEIPAVDELAVMAITKVLSDTATFTDDINGEAVTGDESNVAFTKGLSDTPATADTTTLVFNAQREFDDEPTVEENKYWRLDKTFSDSINLTDALPDIVQGRTAGETPAMTDDETLSVTKQLSETPGVAELAAFEFTMGTISDSAPVTDSNVITFTHVKSEAPSMTDDDTIDFTKVANEPQDVVDQYSPTFTKVAADDSSTADSTVLTVSPQFTEDGTITDTEVLSVTKDLSESMGVSSSGLIRGQNYCDFDYFSEDYVGLSRNFT